MWFFTKKEKVTEVSDFKVAEVSDLQKELTELAFVVINSTKAENLIRIETLKKETRKQLPGLLRAVAKEGRRYVSSSRLYKNMEYSAISTREEKDLATLVVCDELGIYYGSTECISVGNILFYIIRPQGK